MRLSHLHFKLFDNREMDATVHATGDGRGHVCGRERAQTNKNDLTNIGMGLYSLDRSADKSDSN